MSRRRPLALERDPFGISLRAARWWLDMASLHRDFRALRERDGEDPREDIEGERRCRATAQGYLWRRSLWRRARAAVRRAGGLVPWVHALARAASMALNAGRSVPRELGYRADVARKLCDRAGITEHYFLLQYIRALAITPDSASCFVDGPKLLAAAAAVSLKETTT